MRPRWATVRHKRWWPEVGGALAPPHAQVAVPTGWQAQNPPGPATWRKTNLTPKRRNTKRVQNIRSAKEVPIFNKKQWEKIRERKKCYSKHLSLTYTNWRPSVFTEFFMTFDLVIPLWHSRLIQMKVKLKSLGLRVLNMLSMVTFIPVKNWKQTSKQYMQC